MSELQLSGKVAVVSGAARGLGSIMASAFAQHGAKIVALDTDSIGNERTAAMIVASGGEAIPLDCDVTSSAQVGRAVDAAVARFGKIDILVNCAVVFIADGPVTDIDESEWLRSWSVNVHGTFLLCKAVIPVMKNKGSGAILNIASVLGHVGKAGRSWYCGQKAALILMSKAMAVDHAADGIRVNSLSPGPVATEQFLKKYGGRQNADSQRGKDAVLKRVGEPHEIAAAAVFLVSDDAGYVTGTDLLVDGGLTAI